MANFDKFPKTAVGHLTAHFERARDEKGNYVKFSNQNIDATRTDLNYNLATTDQPLKQGEFMKNRLSQVKVLNRADVKTLCSWVVTMPKDLPKEKQKDFFQETYNFLSARYGKENVVSAYVHLDEKTPHLHFAFLPIVEDKKTGKEKLSAKEKVNRQDLKSFHGNLQKHLEQKLNCKVNVINEATKDENKTVARLKREANYLQGEIDAKAERLPRKKTFTGKKVVDASEVVKLQATTERAIELADEVCSRVSEYEKNLEKEYQENIDNRSNLATLQLEKHEWLKLKKQLQTTITELKAENNDLQQRLDQTQQVMQDEIKSRLKAKLEPLKAIADNPYMPKDLSDQLKKELGIKTTPKKQQERE